MHLASIQVHLDERGLEALKGTLTYRHGFNIIEMHSSHLTEIDGSLVNVLVYERNRVILPLHRKV